ncbi:ubiquinone biosynthesis accessory factor UbiJ [Pelistega ratti]|uniref:ubiquinone biosynthesis accessory factor UbiJ n=1 Tax=Pelistega ratti TaxID=2652177 RepID=UPI001356C1DB|nr:hypothetical protein [Pelistega ratti]
MFPTFFRPQSVVVKVLNRLISKEEWALKKTKIHANKNIRFNMGSFHIMLTILPSGLLTLAPDTVKANVILTVQDEAIKLFPTILFEKKGIDEFDAYLHIEGDAGLARLVSELAHDLRWDIEAEIVYLFGPFIGYLLVDSFKKTKTLGAKGLEKTKDFLSQDYHVIVQSPVVQQLKEETLSLQQRLTRLEQRLQRLQKV